MSKEGLICYATPRGYGKTYYELEKLKKLNKKLKYRIDKAIDLLQHYDSCQICEHSQTLSIQIQEILKGDKD